MKGKKNFGKINSNLKIGEKAQKIKFSDTFKTYVLKSLQSDIFPSSPNPLHKSAGFGDKKRVYNWVRPIVALFIFLIFLVFIINLYNQNNKISLYAIKEQDEGTFNLKVEIPETYKNIVLGKPVVFTAKVLNLANDKRVDVTLKYYVIDSKENVIFTKSETLAVETQASFVREVKLAQDTSIGDYTIKAEIIYNEMEEAESQDSFKITKDNKSRIEIIVIAVIIAAIIFFILIFSLSKIKYFIEKIELKARIGKIVKKKMKGDI